MEQKKLLGIKINIQSKEEVLENIERSLSSLSSFSQIISLNSENIISAYHEKRFKKVVETSQIHIIDGSGVAVAVQTIWGMGVERVTGVDLMEQLCNIANKNSLSVVLIGGGPNLANELAKCQKKKYPRANFFGLQGFSDKNKPTEEEKSHLISIVADRKPSLIFVAFGSPFQELWLDCHKDLFAHSVCMGVGGAFDFLSGNITRAPLWMRQTGLEWLYRLCKQPWRLGRQLRLIEFIYRVLLQKLTGRV